MNKPFHYHSGMQSEQQSTSTFLPDFCSVRILFVVILIAELLAIVLALAQTAPVNNRLFDLAMNSLFIQWIALTCVGLLCLCRNWLNRLQDVWTAILSYLLILTVAMVITELAWWSLYILPARGNYFSHAHAMFFLRCTGISAIVGALALRYFYIQHQWRRNCRDRSTIAVPGLAIQNPSALPVQLHEYHCLFDTQTTRTGRGSH